MDRLTILAKALQQVRVVYIQSKAIGEEIAVVLDEDVGKVQVDDGVVVYAFSEIQKIVKGRISDEEIRWTRWPFFMPYFRLSSPP